MTVAPFGSRHWSSSASSLSRAAFGQDGAFSLPITGATHTISSTNPSSSSTTGGLVLAGGLGVAGEIYGGSSLHTTVGLYSQALNVGLNDAVTAAVGYAIVISAQSSGTPAAGYGSRINVNAESTTTVGRNQGNIDWTWVQPSDAIRKARVVFTVSDTSEREFLRGEASGSDARIGFLGAAAVSQQTSGANLTNNVTSGGTTDQIDDFTNLTTYATDAAAIRNAIYQLARKVKQLNDGVRLLGLFT